jgi:hypothetical protein
VLVRHVQIYESGVAVSLFRQCTRVLVSSDRWRQRVAQLPVDVQASVCEEVTADPGGPHNSTHTLHGNACECTDVSER